VTIKESREVCAKQPVGAMYPERERIIENRGSMTPARARAMEPVMS
jgi:hypothetical protein